MDHRWHVTVSWNRGNRGHVLCMIANAAVEETNPANYKQNTMIICLHSPTTTAT